MRYIQNILAALSALMVLGMMGVSLADEGPKFSGNITMTSDYSARGWTQTLGQPAIQGGLDLEFKNGFAIGTWGSSVNFDNDGSLEIDLYASYTASLPFGDEGVSWWKFTVFQYEYPSEGDNQDFQEYKMSLGYKEFSGGIVVTGNYGPEGPVFAYPFAAYSRPLGDDSVVFSAHVGWSWVDTEDYFDEGKSNHFDYKFDVSKSVAGVNISTRLVGTNLDDLDKAEPRIILALSKIL